MAPLEKSAKEKVTKPEASKPAKAGAGKFAKPIKPPAKSARPTAKKPAKSPPEKPATPKAPPKRAKGGK
jgi:hypothetical protein